MVMGRETPGRAFQARKQVVVQQGTEGGAVAREPDLAWDALVAVTNANPSEERGALNRALAQIREQTAELDVDGGELAIIIRSRAEEYRAVWPAVALTASALAKHWERVPVEHERMLVQRAQEAEKEAEKKKRRGTNLHSNNGCTTCGGDHWVVVRHRPVGPPTIWMDEHKIKPVQHPSDRGFEETAPCPVCNMGAAPMQNFWDGRSWEYSSEPGEVRI
jgi:hypothetical protein